MNELSDYFRLKEYDRIELEKKVMIDLKKVIYLCLKKGWHFSVNAQTTQIDVCIDNNFDNSITAYFKGDLINYESEFSTTVSKMLEKLKSIK